MKARAIPVRSLVVLASLSLVSATPQEDADRALVEGIQRVRDGDFEAAVLTLDAAARALTPLQNRSKDAAQASLHLGIAYLHLGQQTLALSRFQQALHLDPDLRVSATGFPAKVVRAFEAARKALAEKRTLEKQARRTRGKGALIVAGVGAVAAGGVALAITRERANTAPAVEMLVTPETPAIRGVTVVNFAARGTDADGDLVSYRWDFGDGTSGTGANVSHVMQRAGRLAVILSASDGIAETRVQRVVSVADLYGTWRVAGESFIGFSEVEVSQGSGLPHFLFRPRYPGLTFEGVGLLTAPRHLETYYVRNDPPIRGPCIFLFSGDAATDLTTIAGTVFCLGAPSACDCVGQQQALTLSQ